MVTSFMGFIILILILVIALLVWALPVVLIVTGIKKSNIVLKAIGGIICMIYLGIGYAFFSKVTESNKIKEVFEGTEVTITDEGLQPEGFYVAYLVSDEGIIEESQYRSSVSGMLYNQKDGYSFKGVIPGDTYVLWYSYYRSTEQTVRIYQVNVDDNLNVKVNVISEWSDLDLDSKLQASDIQAIARDKYGFDEEAMAEIFKMYDEELEDNENIEE